MGEFIVRGKDALELVQRVTSNDASKLAIGDAQYSCLPNGKGGIVDDLLVYRLDEDMCNEGEHAFMLVVNASNIDKDWDWISSHNSNNVEMINISDKTSLLAVQGPKAVDTIRSLTNVDVDGMKYYTFNKGVFAGKKNVLVSATGYTGAGGFEIYARNEDIQAIWEAIFEAGHSFNIQPIGLGARDTLRLEMGYCLYGNDIDDSTSPLEAGLGWITKLKKDAFIDKDRLVNQKAQGLQRKLVGFVMDDKRAPRKDYVLETSSGEVIGQVTSGTQSPSLGYPIGLGYVSIDHAKVGNEIMVDIRGKKRPATIVKLPFYSS